jgi:cell wall-associated NlpC family hydrolase
MFIAGKPGKSPVSHPTPKGTTTYNPKTRKYSGAGTKPKGAKVEHPTPTIVTTSPSGKVTTSGFPSKQAATRAKKHSQAARQRVRAIVALTTKEPPRRSQSAKPVSYKAPTLPKPTSKPPTFEGRKTAGAPYLKDLQVASSRGTLKINRAGYVTTPEVRQAAKKLKTARTTVKRTTGVTGPLTQGQKAFTRQLAKETPLKPRVIASQALAEESGSAAQQRDAEGNYNYLNIGYFDSGPGSLTAGREWSNPKTAAHATAQFLKGKKYGASPSIRSILPASKGKSDAVQIAAIGNSDWATSGAYRESIEGTHRLVGLKRNPKAVKQLKAAKAQAKALGLKVAPQKVSPAPKKVVTRFKAIKKAAAALTSRHIPYVWGGGHGSIESAPTGLDCSGAVSWVLSKAGILKTPLTSGSMGEVLKPGPGAVTVFYNGEHTFMKIGNEYWGTSVGDSGKGGLGPHDAPSASYLAQYNVGHVPGLGKKQALQLGFSPAASESFPGMTVSPSGTTATIDSGAGATQDKPGFSKSPIQLTRAQKVARINQKLKAVGVGVKEAKAEPSVTLEELTKKYSKAVA